MEQYLSPSLNHLVQSAEQFGPRLTQPLTILRSALSAAVTIFEASPRPESLIHSLHTYLDTLDETADALTPTDVLFHHITLISIAASALAIVTVIDGTPQNIQTDAKEEAMQHLQALKSMNHDSNTKFAGAVEAFLEAIDKFVANNMDGPLAFVGEELPEPTALHLVAYRERVISAADELKRAVNGLGHDLEIQVDSFCKAIKEVYNFIVKASSMDKKPADEEVQSMLADIIVHMTQIAELGEKLGPREFLHSHLKAIADAVGMLSWIVAETKPISFVSDAEATADYHLNKVLMTVKGKDDADAHRAFVKALRNIFGVMREYIKEFHTMGLVYGGGLEAKGATPGNGQASNGPDEEEEEEGETYVVAFRRIVQGPVEEYLKASNEIGGQVASQAKAFAGAWKKELEFLEKAYNMDMPDDIQPLLSPIACEMADVSQIAEKVDPRGPYAFHCNAVGESVAALGWVAVDEKATAYIGDMAAAGQFFIDKVKMGAKKTDNPQVHKDWAKHLEMVYKELKAYVKEYHTQKLTWNPPKVVRRKTAKRRVAEVEEEADGQNYVTAFEELIAGPLAEYLKASEAIGDEVKDQAVAFCAAWKEEAEFLKKAYVTPKPEDVTEMLTPIGVKMGEVSNIMNGMNPRGSLAQHCSAIGESVAALGWVAVEEKATAYVGDMAGAGQFFLDKVKMGAKKTNDPTAHRTWAGSVETLLAALKAYVKEHHTQKLVWNPPKVKRVVKRAQDSDDDNAAHQDYVTAFRVLIDGPLAAFTKAAKAIGGEVAEQASIFAAAWEAEAQFLAVAIKTPKPDDFQDMLAPIAAEMGAVGTISEKIDPRGPFANHCNAVSESISALGWVAVDEKATAYVGDMAGAGQFYVDKVKMAAKKTDNPEDHKAWALALETLFKDLKGYVKEYHTQCLVWNPKKAPTRKMKKSTGTVGTNERSGANSLDAFKAIVTGTLQTFVQKSNEIGGEVAKQAAAFKGAWEAEAEFLEKVKTMPKPNDFQGMLAPIAEKMGEVGSIAEALGPRAPFSPHCSAVSESVGALGWVAVDEKATSYVGDMASAGQFFIDKVKMGAKNTDNPDVHRAWAKALETVFVELKAYVKEYHTQVLVWNK